MSDYLHSVLIGYFERTEVIQPRLLALFEPPPRAPDAIDQRNLDSEWPDAVPVPERQPIANRSAAQNLAPQAFGQRPVVAASHSLSTDSVTPETTARPERRAKSSDASAPARPLEATALEAAESSANAVAWPEPSALQRRTSHLPDRLTTPLARSQLRHIEDPVLSSNNEEVESHPQSLRRLPAAGPTADENSVPPQRSRALVPLISRLATSPETKIDQALGEAKTEEASRAAKPIASVLLTNQAAVIPTQPSAAPPIVRVTIGRVEVHAIMPPLAAPPLPVSRPAPARRAAPLSLDKYLKQVNGQR